MKNDNAVVYIFKQKESGLVKVGYTTDIDTRISTLERQGGNEIILKYVSIEMPLKLAKIVEGIVHNMLHIYRRKGEYFACDFDYAVSRLEYILDSEDFARRVLQNG